MSNVLSSRRLRAKKRHCCDYCCEGIEVGEFYNRASLMEGGQFYEWKCHERCYVISNELWEYAGPDDGMDSDLFSETCQSFSKVFVCPGCEHRDPEYPDDIECKYDKLYCTERVYEVLQKHELRRIKTDDEWYISTFKLFPRELEVADE